MNGQVHPHGDSAIYDTLVRLAQDSDALQTLVDGQGNFGSVDDDPAAAMRYTEARLDRLAMEMLRDLDMDTVDFALTMRPAAGPLVLPARPQPAGQRLLGIAVGMADQTFRHTNLREVIDATVAYVENPSLSVIDLDGARDRPDFPTGGIILGRRAIREAYETGRGRVRVQARAHTEPLSTARRRLSSRAALPGQEGRRQRA